jgi:hypothetical protein
MSDIVAHSGVMAGSHTLLVFLPFILAGAGLGFVIRAVSDKVDAPRPGEGPVRLPTPQERPLYRLHMQIRAAGKDAAGKDEAPVREQGPVVVTLPSRR